MEENQLQVPPLFFRAAIQPSSINREERTVEVVFATESPIRIRTWSGDVIYEILSFSNGHVRMERLNAGAPVLDNHRAWGKVSDCQLGVVERAWVSENKGHALLRFSDREAVNDTWNDIANRIVRNVSVGYNVYSYQETVVEGQSTTFTAIDWEPAEISVTPIPADITSGIRSMEKGMFSTVNIVNKISKSMEEEENIVTPPAPVEGQRSAQPPAANPNAQPTPTPPPAPVEGQRSASPQQGDVQQMVQAGIQMERNRVSNIRSAVQTANLPVSFADTLINNGSTLEAARSAILEEWQKNGIPAAPPRMVGPDETDNRRNLMANALTNRANGSVALEDGARQYRHMSLLDMARECLEVNNSGFNTRTRSNLEIAQLALQSRSMHSTSDFPLILGNTINRELMRQYSLQSRTFTPFCRRGSAKDFRLMTRVRLSELLGPLDEVKEGGEYKYATATEGQEQYKVAKYGKRIAITWETLINDDLNAFSRTPLAFANKAAQKQSDIVWSILTGSHLMGDNVQLFHTSSHGNLASGGGAIGESTVSAARLAMRTQKDLNGEDYINVAAKYMVVGPAKETEAQKFLNGIIMATKDSDTNIFKGAYDLIVEPRITGNAWFLVADPNTIDTIEYAFLDGEGELMTSQREGWDIDGIEIKCRMVFGAKAIDWKGFYKNPGN